MGDKPTTQELTASPDNPNEVYFMSNSFFSSIDGGVSLENRPRSSSPNWDHHEMWIDPNNGDRMAVAGDGGIAISQNRGKSWLRTYLPIAQLYHVTTDNNVPYNLLTNRQDGPSMKGPVELGVEIGLVAALYNLVCGER